MYPAIIDKELFQRVQKRLSQNKYFAGGSATAKTIYLLTGKLFCGYCGEGMVAGGGTSRTGVKHYYYVCKKNKKGQCPKKWEHKDDLELYVTSCVIDFLSDRKNAEVAVDEVLKYYEARTDERNIKAIQSKISHIHAKVKKLTDAFVNAKSSLLRNNIETEINEYETQLEKLTLQQAQLELERGYQITREDLLEFITELLKGDRKDKEYQRQIIDHLVHRVYVKDDYTIIYFNISGGENIEIARLDDANNAILNMSEVQTQSPLLHQTEDKGASCALSSRLGLRSFTF